MKKVGLGENFGLSQITERGLATLQLQDEYSTGDEFEKMVDKRADQISIIGSK